MPDKREVSISIPDSISLSSEKKKRTYAEVKGEVEIFIQQKRQLEQEKKKRDKEIGNVMSIIQTVPESSTEMTEESCSLNERTVGSTDVDSSQTSGISSSVSHNGLGIEICGLRAYDLDLNPAIENRLRNQPKTFGSNEWTGIHRDLSLTSFRQTFNRHHVKQKTSRGKSMLPRSRSRTETLCLSISSGSEKRKLSISDQKTSSRLISKMSEKQEDTIINSDPNKKSLTPTNSNRTSLFIPKKFQFVKAVALQKKLMIDNDNNLIPWLEERLDLSSRSCRFGLPMDVFELGHMTPIDYLSKHCHTSAERRKHYKNIFDRGLKKDQKKSNLSSDTFRECLIKVLQNLIDGHELNRFLTFTHLEDSHTLDLTLFSLLSALSERIVYAGFANISNLKKKPEPRDFIEIVDFSGLIAKIEPVIFKFHDLKRLLFSLS